MKKYDATSCPCCGTGTISEELKKKLSEITTPFRVTSGYRCEKHNKDIGGALHSFHCAGLAADIATEPGYLECLWKECIEKFSGVGKYKAHIHVDIGPRHARWFK